MIEKNQVVENEQQTQDLFQRRMLKLQEDPKMQLSQSIEALKFIEDPAQRQAYAAPLIQAQLKAKGGL